MERGYELIKRIAGGGMGEVFVARRTGAGNFEKRVAVKLLLPHLASSDELVARFHEEARLAARMHHPNIVEIFDVGEAEGRPFLAMQLVDGVTLGRLVRAVTKQGSRLPLPLVRLIATGLCEALTYAHTLTDGKGRPLRVVHRDVTPGNLLISRNGAVLLTDFGIAREHAGQMTEPGVVRGKAAYLAPEQVLHDAPVDERADLYSAALTLYEALSGVNPFKRESVKDSLLAVVGAQVERIDVLRSDVTPGLARALHTALARSPDQRFRTAREFREAIADGPVATAPQLGEFVAQYCPEVLAGEVEEEARPGTRSLLNVTPLPLELPDSPGVSADARAVGPTSAARELPHQRDGSPEGRATMPGDLRDALPDPRSASSSAARVTPTARDATSDPRAASSSAARVTPTARDASPDPRAPRTRSPPARLPSPVSRGAPSERSAGARVVGALVVVIGAMLAVGVWVALRRPLVAPPPRGAPLQPVAATVVPVEVVPVPGPEAVVPVEVVAPPLAVVERAPKPAPVRSKPKPPSAPADVRVGYLTADATPWAEVLLGGRVIERTPFVRFPLPEGKHTLVFRGPNGVSQERVVSVSSGQVSVVKVEF